MALGTYTHPIVSHPEQSIQKNFQSPRIDVATFEDLLVGHNCQNTYAIVIQDSAISTTIGRGSSLNTSKRKDLRGEHEHRSEVAT